MSTSRGSLPEPLRTQVEAAALQFATEIVKAFERGVGDVGERLANANPAPKPVKATKTNTSAGTKPATGRSLDRRIEAALRRSEELRFQQLSETLGAVSAELKPALERLMEEGRIGKRRRASGTQYYLR